MSTEPTLITAAGALHETKEALKHWRDAGDTKSVLAIIKAYEHQPYPFYPLLVQDLSYYVDSEAFKERHRILVHSDNADAAYPYRFQETAEFLELKDQLAALNPLSQSELFQLFLWMKLQELWEAIQRDPIKFLLGLCLLYLAFSMIPTAQAAPTRRRDDGHSALFPMETDPSLMLHQDLQHRQAIHQLASTVIKQPHESVIEQISGSSTTATFMEDRVSHPFASMVKQAGGFMAAIRVLGKASNAYNQFDNKNHHALTYCLDDSSEDALQAAGYLLQYEHITARIIDHFTIQPTPATQYLLRLIDEDDDKQLAAFCKEGFCSEKSLVGTYTLLKHATEKNKTSMLENFLLDAYLKDIDATEKQSHLESIAITAIDFDRLDVMKLLVDRGLRVGKTNSEGNSILLLAVAKDKPEFVSYFLSLPGIELNAVRQDGSYPSSLSLLHYAVAGNHIEMAGHLLKLGADPNIVSPLGVTPLHLAAQLNNKNLVKLLIDNNAKHTMSVDGRYPFLLTTDDEVRDLLSYSQPFYVGLKLLWSASYQYKLIIVSLFSLMLGAIGSLSYFSVLFIKKSFRVIHQLLYRERIQRERLQLQQRRQQIKEDVRQGERHAKNFIKIIACINGQIQSCEVEGLQELRNENNNLIFDEAHMKVRIVLEHHQQYRHQGIEYTMSREERVAALKELVESADINGSVKMIDNIVKISINIPILSDDNACYHYHQEMEGLLLQHSADYQSTLQAIKEQQVAKEREIHLQQLSAQQDETQQKFASLQTTYEPLAASLTAAVAWVGSKKAAVTDANTSLRVFDKGIESLNSRVLDFKKISMSSLSKLIAQVSQALPESDAALKTFEARLESADKTLTGVARKVSSTQLTIDRVKKDVEKAYDNLSRRGKAPVTAKQKTRGVAIPPAASTVRPNAFTSTATVTDSNPITVRSQTYSTLIASSSSSSSSSAPSSISRTDIFSAAWVPIPRSEDSKDPYKVQKTKGKGKGKRKTKESNGSSSQRDTPHVFKLMVAEFEIIKHTGMPEEDKLLCMRGWALSIFLALLDKNRMITGEINDRRLMISMRHIIRHHLKELSYTDLQDLYHKLKVCEPCKVNSLEIALQNTAVYKTHMEWLTAQGERPNYYDRKNSLWYLHYYLLKLQEIAKQGITNRRQALLLRSLFIQIGDAWKLQTRHDKSAFAESLQDLSPGDQQKTIDYLNTLIEHRNRAAHEWTVAISARLYQLIPELEDVIKSLEAYLIQESTSQPMAARI